MHNTPLPTPRVILPVQTQCYHIFKLILVLFEVNITYVVVEKKLRIN